MKFGAIIAQIQSDWRFYYMDYEKLKRQIKERKNQGEMYTNYDEAIFIELLEKEIGKVVGFKNMKGDELARRLIHYENAFGSIDWKILSPEAIERLKAELERISYELCQLNKFSRINHTGFLKILQNHDKHTSFTIESTYMIRFTKTPIYYENIDDMIYRLSKLYSILAIAKAGDLVSDLNAKPDLQSVSQKPQAFVRRTAKYWVHPDSVTDVKVHILRNLPVLVFKGKNMDLDQAITSVYFDNANLDYYMGRLEKNEGAKAVRIRWYGSNNPEDVFIERKVHHEDWTGEKSYKSRFSLKEKLVDDYIGGKLTLPILKERCDISDETIADISELYTEIQDEILQHEMKPLIRTFYKRTAFQIPGDATIRISLDTDLMMIKEDGHIQPKGHWKREDIGRCPFENLPSSHIVRFPYAVLEVKLQTDANTRLPQWITDLIDGPLVESVPKFSKYVHGTAILFNHVPMLPFWLPQMNVDISNPLSPLAPSNDPNDPLLLTGAKGSLEMIICADSEDPEALEDRVHLEGISGPSDTNICTSKKQPTDPVNGCSHSQQQQEQPKQKPRLSTASLLRRIVYGDKQQYGPNNRVISRNSAEKRIAIPVRVEPKVFFANERTFLSWLHFSIFLGGVASALVGLGNQHARFSGYVFAVVSIMFAIYALYIYIWRAKRIRNRDPGPYDDLLGPFVLVLAFIIAVIINFAVSIYDN